MVRFCIVEDCTETDTTILAHRFPRNKEQRQKWIEALNLTHHDPEKLYNRHVVCKKHFLLSDYRNAISTHLNTTAIPHLPEPKVKVSEYEPFVAEPSKSSVVIMEVTEEEEAQEEKKPNVSPVKENKKRRTKRSSGELREELEMLTKFIEKKRKPEPEPQKSRSVTPEINVNDTKFTIIQEADPLTMYEQPITATEVIENEIEEAPSYIEIILTDASTQTDQTPSKEEKEEEEIDSEYKSLSKLDIIKLLKARDQTIEKLQNKINKFEAAMSAFRILMNPGE